MGRIRKLVSVSTLGAVAFRNPQERTLRATRQGNRIARQQLAAEQAAAAAAQQPPQVVYVPVPQPVMPAQQPQQQAPAVSQPIPQQPIAGWYVDATDPAVLRWWDGARWTNATQPRQY